MVIWILGLNDMIRTRGLTKVYKTFRSGEFTAVDDVDFHVLEGDIYGFLGPNGAGKTTTIRMLTSIIPPTRGSAAVCGHDVISDSIASRKNIGFMPERPGFYEVMKAEDQLVFYGEFYHMGKRETHKRARELLDIVGLDEFRTRRIKTFSHGMRKRLALAQALLHDPKLLILDEPTGGLDPQGTAAFRDMIREINRSGKTIFLSSHLLSEVQQVCNRVGILNRGRLVREDTVANLRRRIGDHSESAINVRVDNIKPSVVKALESLEGVVGVEAGPEGVLVYTDGAQARSMEINRFLVGKKVPVTALYPVEASLEDVFLEITGGGGK